MSPSLRAAVVGLGVGQQHAKAYANNSHTELVAICDPDAQKRDTVLAQFGNVSAFDDYEQMLVSVKPDIVSICTPNYMHVPQALQALSAHCHVLVEKPMALTRTDCEALIEKSEQSGKLVYIGQEVRRFPQFVEMKRLLEQGTLGDIYYAESTYIHNLEKVIEKTPWRQNRNNYESFIIGGGCHPVDLLRHFLGDPVQVYAQANHFNKKLASEDCISAKYTFRNGAIANVLVAVGGVVPYSIDLKLYGTEGTVTSNNVQKSAMMCANSPSGKHEWTTLPVHGEHEAHVIATQIDHFIDCIVNGTAPLVDVYEGANSTIACIAALESLRSGKVVEITPYARGAYAKR